MTLKTLQKLLMHEDKPTDLQAETPRKCPGRIESSNRERGRKGKPEGELERRCKVMEESGVQTYLKADGPGEKEPEGTRNVNSLIENQITTNPGPHFIISGPVPHPPTPRLPPYKTPPAPGPHQHFKSLDYVRNITQQSMAHSQKTILLNAPPNGANGVYQSHVRTERVPLHGLAHHSHINDRKAMGSPARVSFDYVNGLGSTLFNSYIPIHSNGINAVASKMAPCISERQIEYGESPAFWREKYEELNGRWEAMRIREVKEKEVGVGKQALLEEKYEILRDNYQKLSQEYNQKLEENRQYYLRIQELQATVNKLQLLPKGTQSQQKEDFLAVKLKQKEEQIQELTAKIVQLKAGEGDSKAAFEQKSMLVGLLRKENEQLQAHLVSFQQEMREMHEHVGLLQGELEHREGQPRDRPLKASSMLRSQLDRSFDNSRAAELETHIGKLNAEMTARETAFEREIKQANVNAADLAERLKTAIAERDLAVGSLQEKVGNLESDINKKQSTIRNLRDEVAILRTCPSVYSSTLNPSEPLSDKDQLLKRQLQNLRRSLFQREREKMILKQKLQELQQIASQSKQALDRKKLQNQELRRQLGEMDNLQHEHEKMLEVISKKNADIAEMKEMLSEKEQEAGNFENLTNENDRLRSFMLKKNEELSEMAERLFNQEKKGREAEAAHAVQLAHLEEEVRHLQEVVARREHELSKIGERFEELEGNYSEIELQLERQRHINDEYESLLKANADRIEAFQEELAVRHDQEQECNSLRERLEECEFIINEKEQFEVKALRQIKELSQEVEMRQEELHEMAFQEAQLRDLHHKSTKEIAEFENRHGDLQSKCSDLENELKKCMQKGSKLEKELAQGKKQLKKHEKCLKIIDEYKQKMAIYEMKVITLNMNRNNSALKYHQYRPPAPVFERKVIYQLKEHNDRLLEKLKGMNKTQTEDKNHCDSKEKGDDIIKSRLVFFSEHLEQVIQDKAYKTPPHQRQSPIPSHEIERLRQLVIDMQQQEQITTHQHSSCTPQHLQLLYKQHLEFYRSSNEELEERVESLIKVNKQLKATLENTISNRDSLVKDIYEAELAGMKREVKQLKTQRDILLGKVEQQKLRKNELKQSLHNLTIFLMIKF